MKAANRLCRSLTLLFALQACVTAVPGQTLPSQEITLPRAILAASGDRIGTAVAMSIDAALIGAPGESRQGFGRAGAVYVLERDVAENSDWQVRDRLLPSVDEASATFGSDLALFRLGSQLQALVAAPGAVGGEGRVEIFERGGAATGEWRRVSALAPTSVNGDPSRSFGSLIDQEGEVLLVADRSAGPADAAAVSTYEYDVAVGQWRMGDTLRLSEFRTPSTSRDVASLAVNREPVVGGFPSGNIPYAAIATSQSLGVFARLSQSDWRPITVDTPPVPDISSAFGQSMAFQGEWLLVGDPGADGGGRVHVYRIRAGAHVERRGYTLAPPPGVSSFGANIFLTLVGGSPRLLVAGRESASNEGVITAFRLDAQNLEASNGQALAPRWVASPQVIRTPAGQGGGDFGLAMAIQDDIADGGSNLLVGNPGGSSPGQQSDSGAVAHFRQQSRFVHSWSERMPIEFRELPAAAEFGRSVAVYGDWLAIGAPGLTHSRRVSDAQGMVLLFRCPEAMPCSPTGEQLTADSSTSQGLGRFGERVLLSRDWLAATEPGPGNAFGARIHLYRRAGGEWHPIARLEGPAAGGWGAFARAGVALAQTASGVARVVVGVPQTAGSGQRGFVAQYSVTAAGAISGPLILERSGGETAEFGSDVGFVGDSVVLVGNPGAFADVGIVEAFVFGAQGLASPLAAVSSPSGDQARRFGAKLSVSPQEPGGASRLSRILISAPANGAAVFRLAWTRPLVGAQGFTVPGRESAAQGQSIIGFGSALAVFGDERELIAQNEGLGEGRVFQRFGLGAPSVPAREVLSSGLPFGAVAVGANFAALGAAEARNDSEHSGRVRVVRFANAAHRLVRTDPPQLLLGRPAAFVVEERRRTDTTESAGSVGVVLDGARCEAVLSGVVETSGSCTLTPSVSGMRELIVQRHSSAEHRSQRSVIPVLVGEEGPCSASDATLRSLVLGLRRGQVQSSETLLGFDPATTLYSATVSTDVDGVAIRAAALLPTAVIRVDGAILGADGASPFVGLPASGSRTFVVSVEVPAAGNNCGALGEYRVTVAYGTGSPTPRSDLQLTLRRAAMTPPTARIGRAYELGMQLVGGDPVQHARITFETDGLSATQWACRAPTGVVCSPSSGSAGNQFAIEVRGLTGAQELIVDVTGDVPVGDRVVLGAEVSPVAPQELYNLGDDVQVLEDVIPRAVLHSDGFEDRE